MILHDIALLASDTSRTKAYLQLMIQEEKIPSLCIVYAEDISKLEKEAMNYKPLELKEQYFSKDIPILYLLKQANIKYYIVENKDINSEEIEGQIKGISQKYIIYSGYGGYILKPHLFKLGKKFIHIHAGLLPQYRGSTTAYYSYLQEGVLGASAIFLSEGIDEGEVITKECFNVPMENVDIDYIFEPWMRAKVLLKAIDIYLEKGGFCSQVQVEQPETYYIIHPLLKHMALLKIEMTRRTPRFSKGE